MLLSISKSRKQLSCVPEMLYCKLRKSINKKTAHASTFDFIYEQQSCTKVISSFSLKKKKKNKPKHKPRYSQPYLSPAMLITVYNKDLQDSLE